MLLVIILGNIFSGCLSLPDKPKNLELCIVDYPRMQANCGLVGDSVDDLINILKVNLGARKEPLSYLDKAVAMTPDNYLTLKNYIDELERYAHERCSRP